MICKLVKNKIYNFQIFNFKEKKFIKCTQSLHFKLYTEGPGGTEINNSNPIGKHMMKDKKNEFIVKIANREYICDTSVEINYIRVFEMNGCNKITFNFIYESGNKQEIISKTFSIPNPVPLVFEPNTGPKEFGTKLKNIENSIESYTKDEICGVLESLFN